MTADIPLTPAQRDDLRDIAGVMIPASAEFDVPGADDPAIQADIVATLGRDAGLVREALNELRRRAGQPLTALDPVLKDSHGIAAPRIDYTIGENTAQMMEHGIAHAKEILAAAEDGVVPGTPGQQALCFAGDGLRHRPDTAAELKRVAA